MQTTLYGIMQMHEYDYIVASEWLYTYYHVLQFPLTWGTNQL